MVRAARRPLTAALTAALVPIPLHAGGHHRRHHRSGQNATALQSVKQPRDRRAAKRRPEPKHRFRNHHRGVNAPLGFTVGRPRSAAPAAHAAGDPGDTISDFKFTPHAITIHVGDTITWTNLGPSPHTATATNGSFDTGTLKKGASASHTFSTPGTFPYICTIHPFMHGTVVVLAGTTSHNNPASTSSSGSSSQGSSGHNSSTSPGGSTATPAAGSSPTTTPTASGSARTLPNTGLDVPLALLTATLLLGAGAVIRRVAGPRRAR